MGPPHANGLVTVLSTVKNSLPTRGSAGIGVDSRSLRWLVLVMPGAALMLATIRGPLADPVWVTPRFAFWSVLAITVLCAIGALVVAVIGWRRRLAEVAILGSLLLAVSVLPLAHGLTLPGILYGPNTATWIAALIAVPVGIVVAIPLILPRLLMSRVLARHWRTWSVATMAVSVALAGALLIWPNALPPPRVGSPLTLLLLAVSLAGALALSVRHLRLYRLGRRRASLLASAGFAYLGLSTLVFLVGDPYSIPWWGAHLADAVGVFGTIFGRRTS